MIPILTICIFWSFLGFKSPLSPSAEKKRRQRQNKSDEQAALAREKDRISKMNQRLAKTDEQAALARKKTHLQ